MPALVAVHPRRWNEAWWTMLGAAAMLVPGLVSLREAAGGTLPGRTPVSPRKQERLFRWDRDSMREHRER
jgi:hypothetical protein